MKVWPHSGGDGVTDFAIEAWYPLIARGMTSISRQCAALAGLGR